MNYIKIVVIVILFLGLTGCPPPGSDKAKVSKGKIPKEEGIKSVRKIFQQKDIKEDNSVPEEKAVEAVRTMEIRIQQIPRSVTYTTTLIPHEEVFLSAATPGKIEKIFVDVGSQVAKGQLLVRLDRTQLHQANIQLQNLKADLDRLDALKKAGSVPVQQYDQIKTQYEVAKANYDTLNENTQLFAPFSGIITGKYYEDEEMFSGAPNTTAGKAAIVTIASIKTMKAKVAVSEMFYPYIANTTKTQLTTEVYGKETFACEVLRVYPSVDPATRTFITEIRIPNSADKLRPGMAGRISITLDRIKALIVPASTILKLRGSNERYIFLEKDGKAVRTIVKLGQRYNDMVEIISEDVREGDHLIISGQSRLLDGDLVAVQN